MLQQRMSRVGRIGFGVVLLSSLWSAQAQTNVSLYRYQISLRSGDFEYRDSIPAVVPPSGPYYKVETDRQGRIVRQTSMRSGKELATTQYDYQGAGKLYFRSEKSSTANKPESNRCNAVLRESLCEKTIKLHKGF
jgi:hypothetical protein